MIASQTGLPRRHHYIPTFYLKRWVGTDGKICQFSRPFNNVIPNRKSPSATGFFEDLYCMNGFPLDKSQQIEEKFFSPLDSGAAEALTGIDKYGNEYKWNQSTRSDWTRFILSLLLRCPEDMEILSTWWKSEFFRTTDEEEDKYARRRGADDPPTMAEFLSTRPRAEIEKYKFELFMKLIDNKRVGEKFNELIWKVYYFSDKCVPLITSDRPIIRTNGLMIKNGHLALPIGPRAIFVASPDAYFIERMVQDSEKQVAKEINRHTVRNAVRYVYATDDSHLAFIAKNFGLQTQPRLIKELTRPNDKAPAPIGIE